ncbi:cytidine deaminase [Halobacterium wangiae]|uniref:cytidine deaminase n=1 Tax=Halobacterium wangiae TaxID=2902623 RepID=UPI001E3249CB|nr:cytidine deaminase [Halobacterium wangiae]
MTDTLTSDDEQLIEAARDVIRDAFVHGTHYVGSALRTTSGDVHTGVHVEANVGRASVCAEPVTLGTAVANGVKGEDIDTIVSVRHPGPAEDEDEIKVVSPCGVCREIISDVNPQMAVIYPGDDGELTKSAAIDLLPSKYVQSYRDVHLEG